MVKQGVWASEVRDDADDEHGEDERAEEQLLAEWEDEIEELERQRVPLQRRVQQEAEQLDEAEP